LWLDAQRRQTRAYEEHLYQRVRKTPRNQVAVEEGLSESTVLDIFKKWAHQVTSQAPSDLVRVLGVDEISTQKGHQDFALVLSDLERRRVIAVLPNRQKDTLEQWLDGLTAEQRLAIQQVSMDMWTPYESNPKPRNMFWVIFLAVSPFASPSGLVLSKLVAKKYTFSFASR
jgi:transposase